MKLGRTTIIANRRASIFDQHEIERADELTPITCLDCGGDWRQTVEREVVLKDGKVTVQHYTEYCQYCIRGGMAEAQQREWREDKKKKQLEHALNSFVNKLSHPEATHNQSGMRKKMP